MAEIKSLSAIKDKWARVTPGRSEDYKIGVQNPRRSWEEGAAGQEDAWREGVTQAATQGSFARGVRAAGEQKWKSRTLKKGPSRFAEGVITGAPDYETGFAPYREVIAGVTLPARYPKGDPRNIERVRAIATALRESKVSR